MILAGMAAAMLLAADTSCSLIVDANGSQCDAATVDKDCGAFPGLRSCAQNVCSVTAAPPACSADSECRKFANAVCTEGVCSRSCKADKDCGGDLACNAGRCGAGASGGCKVNDDCASMGTYYICRKDTRACVNLQSSLCTTVYGDYKNDDAFIFGGITPTEGPDKTTGIPIENAEKLAINDITQNANGLPPAAGQSTRRPLVLVGCNDNSDADTAVTAAKHLVDDVGVPAIVGAAFSGITIKVATTVTIPAKVMLFSPSATSVAITNLDTSDPRLVWRSSPPDSFQATALAKYTSDPTQGLEAQVRKNLGLTPTDKIIVTILHKGDAYGGGLATALEAQLTINGAPAAGQAGYQNLDYGNPDDPKTDPINYGAQVAATLAQAPHVIFIFGTNEAVTQVLEPIEEGWTEPSYRPLYVLSDGGEINDLPAYVTARENMSPAPLGAATLRSRISGSVPGTDSALFKTFLSAYNGSFHDGSNPTTFGAAGAYDIVYMLAYGTSALLAPAVKDRAVTGPNLASGMAKLIGPGTAEDVGPNTINEGFSKLLAGSSIDFNGASGPLNFDVKQGEAPSDIQIWCLSKNPDPTKALVNSTLFYDASKSTLSGTFNCN